MGKRKRKPARKPWKQKPRPRPKPSKKRKPKKRPPSGKPPILKKLDQLPLMPVRIRHTIKNPGHLPKPPYQTGKGRNAWMPTSMQVKEAERWAMTGINMDQIAYALDIHPATLYRYISKHPTSDLSESLKRGKNQAIALVAGRLYEDAMSDSRSSGGARIFYLKAQAGWRDRVAVEGVPGAAPIKTEHEETVRHVKTFDAKEAAEIKATILEALQHAREGKDND